MAKIISFENTNPKDLHQNPIKSLWDKFYSLDNFTKGILIVSLLFIIFAAAITKSLLDTRQRAEGPAQSGESKIKYDWEKEKTNVERKKNGKNKISQKDLRIREAIIAKVNADTGLIYRGSSVNIQYDDSADDFLAGIMSIDVNSAKKEAEDWLRLQGLSNEAICNLPLSYLLAPEVYENFPPDQIFSTSPLTCDQISTTTTPTSTPVSVSPTCRPRPACLDATPKCEIPETSDMCPPATAK